MSKGLFNLENFDNMGDNDIISMNINETAEFAHKNPDTNHPEEHFDKDATGAKETSIPVPGGDSETPKAKPYDDKSIPVPNKVTLTTDQYDAALAALKKSFKEGYELMEMLENVQVIDDSLIRQQEAFEEAALVEAMISGPMFEAVNRSDKEKIRDLVKDLRSDVVDEIEKEGLDFYDLGWWNRLKSRFNMRVFGQNFYWQMIGMFDIETQNATDFCKRLTEKFADKLGKYKILCYQCYGYGQLFNFKNMKSKLAGDTKNTRRTFVIFIDRKMNAELTREIDAIRKEVEAKVKKEEDGKKED